MWYRKPLGIVLKEGKKKGNPVFWLYLYPGRRYLSIDPIRSPCNTFTAPTSKRYLDLLQLEDQYGSWKSYFLNAKLGPLMVEPHDWLGNDCLSLSSSPGPHCVNVPTFHQSTVLSLTRINSIYMKLTVSFFNTPRSFLLRYTFSFWRL